MQSLAPNLFTHRARVYLKSTLLIIPSLLFLVLINYLSTSYLTNSDERPPHPKVIQLSTNDMRATFRFTKQGSCVEGTERASCWDDPAYDDSGWLDINEKTFNIRKQKDFQTALENNSYVYYRIWITIPADLTLKAAPLAILPDYIHHKSYQVLVNGEMVLDAKPSRPGIPIITLPSQSPQNRLLLVIKATLHQADLGIYHGGPWYLGNKYVLDKLSEDYSWPVDLFSFCSLASIFIFFSMLSLVTKTRPGMPYFIVFLFCCSIDCLIKADLFPTMIDYNMNVVLGITCRLLKGFALLGFIIKEFLTPRKLPSLWLAAAAVIISGILLACDYGWGSGHVSLEHLSLGADLFFLIICLLTTFICIFLMLFKKTRRSLLLWGSMIFSACYVIFGVIKLSSPHSAISTVEQIFDFTLTFLFAFVCAKSYKDLADRLAQKEREQSKEKIDYVLAKAARLLAHDVRAPFFTLIMSLDFIEELPENSKATIFAKELLPRIRAQLRSVDDTIKNILTIGRDSPNDEGASSFNERLKLALFEILSIRREAKITFDICTKHHHLVQIDNISLQRVLSNILLNAIEAMHQNGKITIRTCEKIIGDSSFLHVSIHNTGSFVPSAIREKIFDLDFTVGKKNGTGLGLAICKNLIERNGGMIWCESDESSGTTFCINTPLLLNTREQDEKNWPHSTAEILRRPDFSPSALT